MIASQATECKHPASVLLSKRTQRLARQVGFDARHWYRHGDTIGKNSESHQCAEATTSLRRSYLLPALVLKLALEAVALPADGATQVKLAALSMSPVPAYCAYCG